MNDESLAPTMSEEEVRQRIRAFILDNLLSGEDPIRLTDSTPLVSGGIIDSLNSLKVGLFLEKSFSIDIAPEELADPENMETVASIVKLVTSKLGR